MSKKENALYWVTTIIMALFILPGIFYINSEMAIEGTRHLGIPEWLRFEVSYLQFLAGLFLILPIRGNLSLLKEWSYVGLGIVYVSAFVAHLAVDGYQLMSFSPLVLLAVLAVSYKYYHKRKTVGLA